jgi:hypothetical protein
MMDHNRPERVSGKDLVWIIQGNGELFLGD